MAGNHYKTETSHTWGTVTEVFLRPWSNEAWNNEWNTTLSCSAQRLMFLLQMPSAPGALLKGAAFSCLVILRRYNFREAEGLNVCLKPSRTVLKTGFSKCLKNKFRSLAKEIPLPFSFVTVVVIRSSNCDSPNTDIYDPIIHNCKNFLPWKFGYTLIN